MSENDNESWSAGSASDKLSEAKDQASQVASQAKNQAKQIASEATHAASDVVADAKQQTVDLLQRQKSNAAHQISTFQAAVQNASDKLRDEENSHLASYTDAAAQKLGQLSDYLENQNLTELMHNVERYARKRPEIVFGGLAVAGLAVARFLKSSAKRSTKNQNSEQMANAPRIASSQGRSDSQDQSREKGQSRENRYEPPAFRQRGN